MVNLYPEDAKLGLHQDGEGPSEAPMVTISIGNLELPSGRLGITVRETGSA
jgi:alkylated DNA repair dioxygenase AlkB